jgi:hypothetical protein
MPSISGRPWKRLRAEWNRRIQAGEPVTCYRCGQPIRRGMPWDLDHVVPVVHGGNGPLRPSHRSCNRSAGALLAQSQRGRKPKPDYQRAYDAGYQAGWTAAMRAMDDPSPDDTPVIY